MHPTIFLDNKYTRTYYTLVERGLARDAVEAGEKHHILPRSMGGLDKDNLVKLTLREHFIAHLLLPKMCIRQDHKQKMVFAAYNMCNRDGGIRTNAKTYERLRLNRSALLSVINSDEGNAMYGKSHTQEHRDKISASSKGHKKSDKFKAGLAHRVSGEGNPMFGKAQSQEKKYAQSEMMKQDNPMHNEVAKQKIRDAKKGTYNCFDTLKNKFVRVCIEEYTMNKDRFKTNNSKEAVAFKAFRNAWSVDEATLTDGVGA
jgi:hypothetical protein